MPRFSRTSPFVAWLPCFKCQRSAANPCANGIQRQSRNPRVSPGTWGSRQHAHKTKGSLKSTGFAAPWCSVRCTALSSRK
jgi:hypothetical protein